MAASGSSSDIAPSFPASSGQLSSLSNLPAHTPATDLLHSFEGNETEQIAGILVGLMAPPQYPVRAPAQLQHQVDHRAPDLPSSASTDSRAASTVPWLSAPSYEAQDTTVRHARAVSHASDVSDLPWASRETAPAPSETGTPRHQPAMPPPKGRWEPGWRSSRSVDPGSDSSYPQVPFAGNQTLLGRSIRPVDSYRPASRTQAAAAYPQGAPISPIGNELQFSTPATPIPNLRPPPTPVSQPAFAYQKNKYTAPGPHAWPSTPARAPNTHHYPTSRPPGRAPTAVPGDSQMGPPTAADLFVRSAQAKEKGADRVLTALNGEQVGRSSGLR